MLDHLSGGRLTVGVGRGGALIEHQRLGVDPALAPAMYHEAFSVLMRAFEADVVDFEGRFYNYKDYVVQMKPVQRPHPPLWYGAPNADAIAWAAPHGMNVVSLGPGARARAISDRYREEWKKLGRDGTALPGIGITRHIVVANTDGEAQSIARAAYPRWREAIEHLWRRAGVDFVLKEIYPNDFDALERIGLRVSNNPDGSLRVYQPPGERNALGRIRFNFPNQFLVYQHDTSDKKLFARDTRAFSHGCMRVQDPEKYAEVLLSLSQPEENFTVARIRSLYGDQERTINLKQPIPVHVTYQTAFVDENGQLSVRHDLYGLDGATLKLMRGDERMIADTPIARPRNTSSKPVMARAPEREDRDWQGQYWGRRFGAAERSYASSPYRHIERPFGLW
jgi:alkanesulfonate monooxygenase SsuD/methylene tetrahydromethanopterin reductase-like flavin-dependent oxidoreductase (luciferase family)